MRLAGLACCLAGLLLAATAEAQTIASVAAEGTQFRVMLSDGRILRSPELVGAALVVTTDAGPVKIRLAAAERDPDAKSGDVWLHTMLVEPPEGEPRNLCNPGPDGRRQGFPIASRVTADGGTETTEPERFEIVCSAGARAKCVRFGYRPWRADEAELYDSCTRMVRADYCGLGEGTTRDGMAIDLYDDRRIQTPDNAAAQTFEAGWTPRGAVCVNHVRVPENTSLDQLVASCPGLAGKIGPACTEDAARALGAVLFNRSKP